MIESPLIAELIAEAEARGEAKGWVEGWVEGMIEAKVEVLLRILQKRFGPLPEALVASIRARAEEMKLNCWIDATAEAPTLDQFRQHLGP